MIAHPSAIIIILLRYPTLWLQSSSLEMMRAPVYVPLVFRVGMWEGGSHSLDA